jgi:hypothetical protein
MKLNAYPIESYASGDYIFAKRNGVPGVLIDPTTLPSVGGGPVDTFYTADGTLPSARQVAMDGYALSFVSGSAYFFHAQFAAPGISSNFSFYAEQATLQADKVFDISTGLGIAVQVYGDGSMQNSGSVGINITPDALASSWLTIRSTDTKRGIYVSSTSNGQAATFEANTGYAVVATGNGPSALYGENGSSGIGVRGISDAGIGGSFTGATYGVIGLVTQAGGFGVYGYANAAGSWGVFALKNAGAGALNSVGGSLFETSQTASIHASAEVQINSTTKGFLPPRMQATEAEAIAAAEGLLVYATNGTGVTITSKGWWGFDGTNWVKLN